MIREPRTLVQQAMSYYVSRTVGAAYLKGTFVAGAADYRTRRIHLPVEACAMWTWDDVARLVVRTKCGTTLWRARSYHDAPDDLTLCDNCVLADFHTSPVVYRLLDASGQRLYVGYTVNLLQRIGTHQSQAYWPQVATITYDQWPTSSIALLAEEAEIRKHQPPYNCQFTGRSVGKGRRHVRVLGAL